MEAFRNQSSWKARIHFTCILCANKKDRIENLCDLVRFCRGFCERPEFQQGFANGVRAVFESESVNEQLPEPFHFLVQVVEFRQRVLVHQNFHFTGLRRSSTGPHDVHGVARIRGCGTPLLFFFRVEGSMDCRPKAIEVRALAGFSRRVQSFSLDGQLVDKQPIALVAQQLAVDADSHERNISTRGKLEALDSRFFHLDKTETGNAEIFGQDIELVTCKTCNGY